MTFGSFNLSSWIISLNPRNQQKHMFPSTSKSDTITLKQVKCTGVGSSVAVSSPRESNESIQGLLAHNTSSSKRYYCPCCSRRNFLGAALATGLLPICPSLAWDKDNNNSMTQLNKFHPPRPDWYEEFYASAMERTMDSYEAEISGYKSQLFSNLRGNAKNILEIGIGTGPNLKYYADCPDINVFGVDPNKKMEKYVKAAAENAGIAPSNFKFVQAVAEALPLNDGSFDAVVGTLVLCSVKDVDLTLQEVRRVLKPGGFFVFVEHVAAKDGTFLKGIQGILDPLQQAVADGCHLTRNTAKNISHAGFSSVDINQVVLPNLSLISPHVYGIARK